MLTVDSVAVNSEVLQKFRHGKWWSPNAVLDRQILKPPRAECSVDSWQFAVERQRNSHGATEGAGLSRDQLTDVRDVAFADRAALTGQDRGDGEGVARERHELDFVSFAIAMDVHNGADIAGFQAISRKTSGQDNTIVFVNAHSSKG